MGKKVIRLTEEGIEKIIRRILKEQTQSQSLPTNPSNNTFEPRQYGSYFELGKYKDDNGKIEAAIKNDKTAVDKFMSETQSPTFTAEIIAGESLVPNQAEFKKPGSLALARAKTVYDILTKVYSQNISDGQLDIIMPTLDNVKFGTTPYNTGDENDPAKLEQYKKEQFVAMRLKGTGISFGCDSEIKIEGSQATAPDFKYIYDNTIMMNKDITGVQFFGFTVPDRPIIINDKNQSSVPPYFVRETSASTKSEELRFVLELSLKSYLYPKSPAFAGVELTDYPVLVKGWITNPTNQKTIGEVFSKILKSSESSLNESLKKFYESLTNANNILTVDVYKANLEVINSVFLKSPKIITRSKENPLPFNLTMDMTKSFKVGSYAPLDDTVFKIKAVCKTQS